MRLLFIVKQQKTPYMKRFLTLLAKNTGSILILAGVAVLAIAQFKNVLQNDHLLIAAILFIVGIIVEVIINKRLI